MVERTGLSHDTLRYYEKEGLAASLVRVPPLALLYGWLAFTFVPVLAVLTSADAIAAERKGARAAIEKAGVDLARLMAR